MVEALMQFPYSNRLSVCPLAYTLLAIAGTALAQPVATSSGWHEMGAILEQIRAPEFPDRKYPVTNYGAVGDGKFDCRRAFHAAIAACSQAGGGIVEIPEGNWFLRGPVKLESHVNVSLHPKATLLFSTNPDDFLPAVFTRFEGTEVMNYSPLIYAIDAMNVAITGGGTLDGQAGPENWWQWKKKGDPDIAKLNAIAEEGVPPEERTFGKGFHLRPSFVQFYRCKNVLVDQITLKNSPMWLLHPVLCENVTIRRYTADSHGPNNDGCNPESCRNVLIEDSYFDTGDDCIAIKSGRNADGRRINVPSENIIIRRCTMKDGHGGVVLGSEMSGGIRRVFVEDCVMDSPQLERAIRLKSNSLRGGYLEDLFVRNIQVGEVSDAVIHIYLKYASDRGEYPPRVRNIFIDGVESQKGRRSLYLVGLLEQPITGVVIENCTFRNAKVPSVIEAVSDLTFRNVWQPEKGTDDRDKITASPPRSASSTAAPTTGKVTYSRETDGVSIYADGKLFTRYLFQSGTRPVLSPIIGPTGQPMTRLYPVGDALPGEPTDHVHHRSMWVGYEGLNGVDFWHEPEDRVTRGMPIGTVRHGTLKRLESVGPTVVLTTENDWLDPQGSLVCKDERTLEFAVNHPLRWIDFQIKFWNPNGPLQIGDSKEGLVALRVAAPMAVDAGLGGKIVNSRGDTNEDTWGRLAEWVTYQGPVDGETIGITMMSHPTSFIAVPRWHVRTYGLFGVNPFGVAPFTDGAETRPDIVLGSNEPLKLRYRILLHPGDVKQAEIAEHYREWSRK